MFSTARPENLHGKTICGRISSCHRMLLAFTDRTAIIFEAAENCDMLDICWKPATVENVLASFTKYDVIGIGLMTKDEWNDAEEKRNQEFERERDSRRRLLYEQLKKEFEGK